jgi:hypothetical protein
MKSLFFGFVIKKELKGRSIIFIPFCFYVILIMQGVSLFSVLESYVDSRAGSMVPVTDTNKNNFNTRGICSYN